MKIVKINGKQSKIKLEDGSRFKAVSSRGSCRGCHFESREIACPSSTVESGGELGRAMCTPEIRMDNSHIIWVPRKEKQDGA